MNSEKEQFLNLRIAPARLSVEQAAWYLGFSAHEIPILVSEGLLKPLGHPAKNAPKFFAYIVLEEFRRDVKWLGRACDAISNRWKFRNQREDENASPSRETSCTQ
jgi:hypothetical protein